MKVPVRTLQPRDVEILARSSVTATASKGYVERHGLRWRSDTLLEWELRQRNLRRGRKVELLIDELDLSTVFVLLPSEGGHPQIKLRAVSTKPEYAKNLSLFEHQRLKVVLREKHLVCRLERMADRDLCEMRQEYFALLGRQSDPISARRLEKLRDQLAERRLSIHADIALEDKQAEVAPLPEEMRMEAEKLGGANTTTCLRMAPSRGRRNKSFASATRKAGAHPSAIPEPPVPPSERTHPEHLDKLQARTDVGAHTAAKIPTYSVTQIKRTPR